MVNKRSAGTDRTFYLEAAKEVARNANKFQNPEKLKLEHLRNYRRLLLKEWGMNA